MVGRYWCFTHTGLASEGVLSPQKQETEEKEKEVQEITLITSGGF